MTAYLYVFVKERFEQELDHEMEIVGDLFRANTLNRLRVVEEIVENTALALSQGMDGPQRLGLLQEVVTKNKGDIYGMALAHVVEDNAPYYYRLGKAVKCVNLADRPYRYRQKPWFQDALSARTPQWSAAYWDADGGDILMSTYSVPICDDQGEVVAILTGDLSLEWLTDELNKPSYTNEHQRLLLTDHPSGMVLSGPEALKKTLQEVLDPIAQQEDRYAILSTPIAPTDWDVHVVFSQQKIQEKLNRVTYFILLFGLLGAVLIVICIYFIGTAVAKPLRYFADKVARIGQGQISTKIPYADRRDEIGTLARAFDTMQHELHDYIASVRESEIQKQRLASELAIGVKIQQALLPDLQLLKDERQVEIGAYLMPAKEVGGDLYDCFMIEPNKMCFFIGDVAGKGIPAALYMNGIRAYVRALVRQGKTPAEILGQINHDLSVNNALCMFATLVCGTLCTDTGVLSVANAGHEQPIIVRRDGRMTALSTSIYPAVAIMDNVVYIAKESVLQAGDTLFLYTDGVVDALDAQQECFGKDRLWALLAEGHNLPPTTLVETIRKSLETFTASLESFDDITLMAIRYKPI